MTSPACTAIAATTLATSSAAPPPKPITQSAPCALNAATPSLTCDAVGLPCTPRIHIGLEIAGEVLPELGQHRQCGETAVGHDQRPSQAEIAQVPADELARAGAEVNAGREGKAVDRHGTIGSRGCEPSAVRASRLRRWPAASVIAANATRRSTVKPSKPFISLRTEITSTDDHYRAWRLPGKKRGARPTNAGTAQEPR